LKFGRNDSRKQVNIPTKFHLLRPSVSLKIVTSSKIFSESLKEVVLFLTLFLILHDFMSKRLPPTVLGVPPAVLKDSVESQKWRSETGAVPYLDGYTSYVELPTSASSVLVTNQIYADEATGEPVFSISLEPPHFWTCAEPSPTNSQLTKVLEFKEKSPKEVFY
jgi:hypothetical protein